MLVADPAQRVTLKELKELPFLVEKIPAFSLGEVEVSAETVNAIAKEQEQQGSSSSSTDAEGGMGGGFGEGADDTPLVPSVPASPEKASRKGGSSSSSSSSPPASAEEFAAAMEKPKSFYPNKGPASGAATNFAELEASLDETKAAGARPPRILNAFDLINQCGGFALDKLFAPQLDFEENAKGQLVKRLSSKKLTGGESSPSKERESMMTADDKRVLNRQASMRIGGASNRRTGSYHYSSTIDPPTLMKGVYAALEGAGFVMSESLEEARSSGRCRGDLQTPAKGMLGVNVFVYTLCSSLSLLEICRARGDHLEWNTVYDDLVNTRLASLINRPSGEGEAKSDVSPRPGYAH
jgi:hypothetical protein